MTSTPSVEAICSRAWELLRRNPVIIVPPAIITLLAIAAGAALFAAFIPWRWVLQRATASGPIAAPPPVKPVLAMLLPLFAGVVIAASIATYAFAYGMAAVLWDAGTVSLADGFAALRRTALPMLLFGAIVFVLLLVTIVPGILTLGLGFFALGVFLMYALPALMAGRPAVAAVAESFRLVRGAFIVSVVAAAIIAGLNVAAMVANAMLCFLPIIGSFVSLAIGGALAAYTALVQTGLYRELRAASGTLATN